MQWAGFLDEHLVLSIIHPVHLGEKLVLGIQDKAPVFVNETR
jgi:hypothetical protein